MPNYGIIIIRNPVDRPKSLMNTDEDNFASLLNMISAAAWKPLLLNGSASTTKIQIKEIGLDIFKILFLFEVVIWKQIALKPLQAAPDTHTILGRRKNNKSIANRQIDDISNYYCKNLTALKMGFCICLPLQSEGLITTPNKCHCQKAHVHTHPIWKNISPLLSFAL